MKIFKELKKLGYIHYSATTIEELDDLPLNSAERVSEQALALRWFREKYQLHSTITSISQESWQWHITKPGESLGKMYQEDFYTYEEAEQDCLVKLIDIIENK
jgi:hypothetical protein